MVGSLWILKHHFTILELAQLIGILDSNATLCRWARADYFVLLNCLRDELRATYQIAALQIKAAKKYHLLKACLPHHLEKRVASLIAGDIAALLWKSHTPIPMTNAIRHFLTEHHAYLSNPANPWEIPIAYNIDRDYDFLSTGDASELSVGAFCGFWTCIDFHEDLRARFNLCPKNPLYMHINLFNSSSSSFSWRQQSHAWKAPLPFQTPTQCTRGAYQPRHPKSNSGPTPPPQSHGHLRSRPKKWAAKHWSASGPLYSSKLQLMWRSNIYLVPLTLRQIVFHILLLTLLLYYLYDYLSLFRRNQKSHLGIFSAHIPFLYQCWPPLSPIPPVWLR
jgi:hypothetical protein